MVFRAGVSFHMMCDQNAGNLSKSREAEGVVTGIVFGVKLKLLAVRQVN